MTKKRTPGKVTSLEGEVDTPLTSFKNEVEAGQLVFVGASPQKAYSHATIRGFYVFVAKPTPAGFTQRYYGARYNVVNAKGKTVEKKVKFGTVASMTYKKAEAEATGALQRAREARLTGKPILPTLQEAFESLIDFKTTMVEDKKKIKATTVNDYRERFNLYVPKSWLSRPVDELTTEMWGQLRRDCTTSISFTVRERPPVSESRFDGMLKGPISGLYRRVQATGHPLLVNPVPAMRELGMVSGTKLRHDYIPPEKFPELWQFLETEIRGPQGDIVLIGVLTGWRKRLMCGIPLDRINEKRRTVEWRATDPGGPYAEDDGDAFAYPVSDFLWEKVFAPRLKMLRPGQKFLIESERGKKTHTPFLDIRDSLAKLDELMGIHVTNHVLRKTFGTVAPEAKISNVWIGKLMMHKGGALEGASAITGTYQKRDYTKMREAANAWAEAFQKYCGIVKVAPVIPGIEAGKLASLQRLAEMPPEALDKLLRLADQLK